VARARVVARMDADDLAHPRRLAAQLARLRDDPQIGVLACASRRAANASARACGLTWSG
jgi:hypothetical protein